MGIASYPRELVAHGEVADGWLRLMNRRRQPFRTNESGANRITAPNERRTPGTARGPARKAARRKSGTRRPDASGSARLGKGFNPTSAFKGKRGLAGNQRRLFGLVLLALARRLLPTRCSNHTMVRPLRGPFPNRGTQCAFLFLANTGHGSQLDTAGWPAPICLYRKSIRADHAHKTFYRNKDTYPRLRTHRRSSRLAHGLFPFSTSAQFSFHESAAPANRFSTGTCPAQCGGVSASQLVERRSVRGLSRKSHHVLLLQRATFAR